MLNTTISDSILEQYYSNSYSVTNSHKIKQLENTARYILENNLYTDLSRKDNDGNTYLHHCCYNNKLDDFVDLLTKGINPFSKNNSGQNAFYNGNIDFLESIWWHKRITIFSNFKNESWDNTKVPIEFKQEIFERFLGNNLKTFNSYEQIIFFLTKQNLFTNDNFCKLLLNSSFANNNINSLADYIVNNHNSPKLNTVFLKNLNSHQKTILEGHFLNSKLEINTDLWMILEETIQKIESLSKFFNGLINNIINISSNIKPSEKIKIVGMLQKAVNNNPEASKILLDITLKRKGCSKPENKQKL